MIDWPHLIASALGVVVHPDGLKPVFQQLSGGEDRARQFSALSPALHLSCP